MMKSKVKAIVNLRYIIVNLGVPKMPVVCARKADNGHSDCPIGVRFSMASTEPLVKSMLRSRNLHDLVLQTQEQHTRVF